MLEAESASKMKAFLNFRSARNKVGGGRIVSVSGKNISVSRRRSSIDFVR